MKNLPIPATPNSLNSSQRVETFDEKTHFYNSKNDIFTRDGRLFEVQELRVRSSFAWEQIYLVEMDLVERQQQYILPFQVSIRWEEMFGHDALPNAKMLVRMARTVIGEHLESHRISRGRSCKMDIIRLHLPKQTTKHDIHPHNY